MPKYRADVWLGSASGRQRVYVNANTSTGAKEQIRNIYNVSDDDIRDLFETAGEPGEKPSGGLGSILAVLIALGVGIWKYVLEK